MSHAVAIAPTTAHERARFRLEGVASPIVARVAERRDDALVLVQELPFLKLDARVLGEGDREARLARVSVDVDGEVPRLVLELSYEAPRPSAAPTTRRRRDETVGYERPSSIPPAPIVVRDAPARGDATEPTTRSALARRPSDDHDASGWRALWSRVEAFLDRFATSLARAFA